MFAMKTVLNRLHLPLVSEDILGNVLDVGIDLVTSFDVENINSFPAIHGMAALPGRGPPSLRRFHSFPTMRRSQKDPPSPSLETQNLSTQARSTLDIALARGSSEAHVVVARISRQDFAQVLHRPRCVEPKQGIARAICVARTIRLDVAGLDGNGIFT